QPVAAENVRRQGKCGTRGRHDLARNWKGRRFSSIPTCVKGFVMRKFLILAIVGSNFIFLSPGNAADSVKPPMVNAVPAAEAPAPRAPIAARTGRGGATTVPASGTPLVLEAGKGTLIRLDRPAATVFVANPDVADVQVKSPSLIYVTAKAPG